MTSKMRARKPLSMPVVLCGLALCFFCFAALAPAPQHAAPVADDDGKEAFEKNCAECHGVKVAEIEATTKDEKLKGPDLVDLGERFEAEWIVKYVKKEADKDGKAHKKKFKGSDEELQVLVDWLLEQKAEG